MRKKLKKGYPWMCREKMMERKYLNVGHVMNMVIMHLSVLKEKINLRESLDLGGLETTYMLMKKKNEIIVKVMIN